MGSPLVMREASSSSRSSDAFLGSLGGGPSMWNCSTSSTSCGWLATCSFVMPDTDSMASHCGGRPRKPVGAEASTCTCMLCLTLKGVEMKTLNPSPPDSFLGPPPPPPRAAAAPAAPEPPAPAAVGATCSGSASTAASSRTTPAREEGEGGSAATAAEARDCSERPASGCSVGTGCRPAARCRQPYAASHTHPLAAPTSTRRACP